MQEQVLAVCRSRNSEYSCRCAPAKDRQAGRWNNPLVLKPSHHPPKIDPQWDNLQNMNKTLTTRSRSASSVGRLGQSWEMKQYPGLADMPMENAMLATAEGKQTFKMYLEQAVRTWHFLLNLDLIIYWIPYIIQVLNLIIVKMKVSKRSTSDHIWFPPPSFRFLRGSRRRQNAAKLSRSAGSRGATAE